MRIATAAEADLILTNAKVITVDERFSLQEAVAIEDGRFVAVGRREDVEGLRGAGSKVIDVGGKAVIPGLIDSHCHPSGVGLALGDVDLYEVGSIAELIERLAAAPRRGEAIVGRAACLDEAVLAEGRLPRATDLDRVADDRPVIVTDVSKTIVNSPVLKSIGVTRETPDPKRGRIERDSRTGEPTGVFLFAAKGLTPIAAQSGSAQDIPPEDALLKAQEAFVRRGLTSVVDGSVGAEQLGAYRALSRRGDLRVRWTLLPRVALLDDPETMDEMALTFGAREGRITIGPLKVFFDPFIMHKTALLHQPYEGEPGNRGYATMEDAKLGELLDGALAKGWPVGIHTTGDRGIDIVTDALAGALSRHGDSPGPSHVIHCYLPTERALGTLRDAGIRVAIQPPFITCWGETLRRHIGPDRAARFTPAATLLDRGVITGGGSDAPIAPLDPFLGMYAAVTRKTLAGKPLGGEERLSREDALRLYTQGSASVTGEEEIKGSIEVGKLADLVVLDRDLLTVGEEEMRRTEVEMTIIEGEVVYERGVGTGSL